MFVARVPKEQTDEQLQSIFAPYGTVESCKILRDVNQVSKGVAFVQFQKRSEAMRAIAQGQNIAVPGQSHCYVVKMAESQKEKEMRKGLSLCTST